MSLISWLFSLSTLVLVMIEGVTFQRATLCRQKAWLRATELKTGTLLSEVSPHARDWHLGCRIHFYRNQDVITWQMLPNLKENLFTLPLKGKL